MNSAELAEEDGFCCCVCFCFLGLAHMRVEHGVCFHCAGCFSFTVHCYTNTPMATSGFTLLISFKWEQSLW